jgi:hypothetical protein
MIPQKAAGIVISGILIVVLFMCGCLRISKGFFKDLMAYWQEIPFCFLSICRNFLH